MKNLLPLIVLSSYILAFFPLFGQQSLSIQGTIIDQKLKTSVPFAHIGMPGQGIGTVANEQGIFTFKFPESLKNELIEISHIGYYNSSTTYEKVSSLENPVFTLQPHTIYLDGVEVLEAEHPLTFYVKKAAKALSKNYPSRLHFMSGFYREAKVNEETLHYDRLMEAAVDIQDKGLKSARANIRIEIRELRKSDDFSDYSELNKRLQSRFGDRNRMYDLFIRNPIRSYLVEENPLSMKYNILQLMQTHENRLKLKEVTYKNDAKIYVIDYEDQLFSASLFIDSQDYGIHQLELYADLNFNRKKKKADGSMNPIDRSKTIGINKERYQYQKIEGQYYLSLMQRTSFEDFLNSKDQEYDKVSSYSIQSLMINDFHTRKKDFDRIKWKETEKKDISAYNLQLPYNEEFWKSYNILQLKPLNPQVKNDLEWALALEAQFKKNGKTEKKK